MNAPDLGGSGPEDPKSDDTFDHFFSKRPQRDPDETRPVPTDPPQGGPDDATQAWGGTPPPSTPRQVYPDQQSPDGWHSTPVPPEEVERRRSGAVLPLMVIVASLIVVAVVAYFALANNGKSPSKANTSPLPSASGPASPQSGASSESSAPSSSSSSSSSTSSSSKALPKGTADCHSSAYSVGPKTSCEFGASVAAAAASAKFSNGSASLTGVYSPTTKKKYTLTCTEGGYLTCVSTTGAVVYVETP